MALTYRRTEPRDWHVRESVVVTFRGEPPPLVLSEDAVWEEDTRTLNNGDAVWLSIRDSKNRNLFADWDYDLQKFRVYFLQRRLCELPWYYYLRVRPDVDWEYLCPLAERILWTLVKFPANSSEIPNGSENLPTIDKVPPIG